MEDWLQVFFFNIKMGLKTWVSFKGSHSCRNQLHFLKGISNSFLWNERRGGHSEKSAFISHRFLFKLKLRLWVWLLLPSLQSDGHCCWP